MGNILALWGIPLALGFLIDLLIGDPHFFPHPIRLIGNLISKGEDVTRNIFPKTKKGENIGGAVMTCAIALASLLVPTGILFGAYRFHEAAYYVIATIMCYQILAVKSLKTESMKVAIALEEEGLESGKRAVSMIVGRDTRDLTEEGVIKATVETVAENTSDGTVAPMLYMALGGAPVGFFYKAVNTMDSMIGYKNEKYLHFGKFAARLDDVLNFVPARLSGLAMIMAAFLTGLDYKTAARIFKRDRFNHASPNSAQTESVCAGALNVQLAGDAIYFGTLYEKKTIGDDLRPIGTGDIALSCKLLYATAWITLTACLMLMTLCSFVSF